MAAPKPRIKDFRRALAHGQHDTVLRCIDTLERPDMRRRWLAEALRFAVGRGLTELVRDLVDRGADPNRYPTPDGRLSLLALAIRDQRDEITDLLIEAGANVNAQHFGTWDGFDGETPLMWAVNRGKEVLARRLITQGADVHARCSDGGSVLFAAGMAEDPHPMLALVLDAGAHPGVHDHDGRDVPSRLEAFGAQRAADWLRAQSRHRQLAGCCPGTTAQPHRPDEPGL